MTARPALSTQVYAHERVATFLESQGCTVLRSYLGVATALRAEFGRRAAAAAAVAVFTPDHTQQPG